MKREIVMTKFEENIHLAEAQERWGNTKAYKEYIEKTAGCTNKKRQAITDGLDAIFIKFAECKALGYTAESNEAQTLVKELRTYITEYFYICTNDILAGLGQMYVEDERFKNNINRHGQNTAEFVNKSINTFCK